MLTTAGFLRGNSCSRNSLIGGSVAVKASDVNLQAAIGSAPSTTCPALRDGVLSLSLSIERPGSFICDIQVPTLDIGFQFMNTIYLFKKQLNWAYNHMRRQNKIIVEGSLVLDPANKLSATYEFHSSGYRLGYIYVHKEGTSFESRIAFTKKSLVLAIPRRILDDNAVRACYETSINILGLEWSHRSFLNKGGSSKVRLSFLLAEGISMPRVYAESTWNSYWSS